MNKKKKKKKKKFLKVTSKQVRPAFTVPGFTSLTTQLVSWLLFFSFFIFNFSMKAINVNAYIRVCSLYLFIATEEKRKNIFKYLMKLTKKIKSKYLCIYKIYKQLLIDVEICWFVFKFKFYYTRKEKWKNFKYFRL